MAERLIDAADILVGWQRTGIEEYDEGKEAGIDLVLAIIDHLPTIEAKPVVHAHWNEDGRCTNCGEHAPFWAMASTYYESKYCHGCGAQMYSNSSEKPNSSVKIPVISMEDVPKIMEEMN